MTLSKYALSAALIVACGFAALEVTGQEPTSPTAPAAATAATATPEKESRGPLPALYGRLGLSDETKGELYKIDDEYDEKIETLLEQIRQLQAERDARMMEVLSETERARLIELREKATAKKAEAVKLRNAAKNAKPATPAEDQATPTPKSDEK